MQVELSVEKSSFHLVVDGFRVSDGLLPNDEGSSLQLLNPVYLGSDLGGRNTKVHPATVWPPPFSDCRPLLSAVSSFTRATAFQ